MNEQSSAVERDGFSGSMFLYTQPELLTKENHGHLGINRPERPYDFAKSARAVPISLAEMRSAQRDYPIVFSDAKRPALLAALGVLDDVNLFVDENGDWDRSAYVPAYLRCYPFALASRPDGQHAIIIDRASPRIVENGEQPFFDGDVLAAPVQEHVNFCAQYHAYIRATDDFCTKVVELDLLSGQQVQYKGEDGSEEKTFATYVAVDQNKVDALDADTVLAMHKDGMLSSIYAQGFSLDNWIRLLERRKQRGLNDLP